MSTSTPKLHDSIRVELAIDTRKPEDEKNLIDLIRKIDGLSIYELNTSRETVVLDLDKSSALGIVDIQNKIENSIGLTTVIKGVGNALSAVSELRPPDGRISMESGEKLFGVIRFSQLLNRTCYVDGLIDRLPTEFSNTNKLYSASIHEYGDLSGSKYENLGKEEINLKKDIKFQNDLNVSEGRSSSISFKTYIEDCDLASLIGRGVAISDRNQKESSTNVLSAGIISRASTVSENLKQICACSGKTIWQERLDIKARK